jgi:hypothetical protein
LGERATTSVGQDALVVVTELVTNGVIHNGGDEIVVCAEDHDESVGIWVRTTPLPSGHSPFPRPNVDAAETGRGMAMVAALCRDVRIQNTDGRRVVTCELMFA